MMKSSIKYLLSLLLISQFLNCKKDEDTTVSVNATVANLSEGTVDFKSGDYDIGSSITITATPKTGYVFSSWTNTSTNQTYTSNPLSITVNENTNLVANFEKVVYNIMFTISGEGSVQKEVVGGGGFTHGSQVKLTATPSENYSFFYWNNDPGDTENPKTITLEGDQNIPTKFDYQVARDLVGNWEFLISDPASKNVTTIKMSIDIFLNVLMTTIVNGEVISQIFTQMVAISTSAIVIGDFAVITDVVVASATSLSMKMISIPEDTVPPTKESDIPEIFYWLLYLDTSKELNLTGIKSDEEPETDEDGIIIPPIDAITASSTTQEIGAIFDESFDKLAGLQSSTLLSDTSETQTATSTAVTVSDASCSLKATLLESVSSDNQTVVIGSPIDEIIYYIVTDCTRVIHLVSSAGLPSGVSASIVGDVIKISGTPTANTSGTFNYSVVIDNHLDQTSLAPYVSATVSNVVSGTISVINIETANSATTINASDTSTSTYSGTTTSTISADTTPPVISITGSASITITEGDTYTDAGATATDDVSGDLTSSIVTTNPVDTSTPGTYTVTYTVTDAAGNTTSIGRMITVLAAPPADTTPPVISITGSASITITEGDTYTDAGATATDDVSGDLTSSIVTTNPVDTSTPGTYTVTYTVTDAAGNTTTVGRMITVLAAPPADTTPPVISITGSASITITEGDTYTDAGATATDDVSGDLTSSIVTTNPVDTSTPGTYTVTYTVTDAAGNTTTVGRMITVLAAPPADTTPPVISITGSASITITEGDTYTDAGATATDDVSGDLTSSIVTTNPVDTSTPGTYTVTYTVTDAAGNTTTVGRMITVLAAPPADTTPPVISITGSASITITEGDTYTDAGATATDDVSGDLTSSIVTTNPVDTSTPGTYTVTYTVTDAAGNTTTVGRMITVLAAPPADTTPPVISITGSASITITEGDTYTDAGATATDDVSGDLTSSIVTTNPVDTSTPGTYTVTYTVTDAAGNTTSIGRMITVLAAPSAETYTINVTASNASNYTLSGSDRNGSVSGSDPSVAINIGDTINFAVNASGHPFYLKTVQGTGTSNLISGVTNNGVTNGTVSWTPTASGTYYYQCSLHYGMYGTITVN